ncbi:MAG: hypothetical protein IT431_08815 [Phycisphaerales bacterium]|nr:hypothetical protein [Phycisphaerales bacterium]
MSMLIARLVVGAAALVMGPDAPLPTAIPPAVPPVITPDAPVGQPASQPASQPAPQPAITDADTLLTALETAGQDIRRLSATVRYIKTFAIQGDQQQRDGTLMFLSEPGAEGQAPTRRFAITFDRYEIGERLEDPSTGFLERYIFDGEWLAEVRPLDKEFVRRQVVPPGQRWDPLALGEGPFPIPIQQKRAEILSRFDAALVDGLEGVDEPALRAIAAKCYQLVLTPRADAGEQDLRSIRVWYQTDTLLPRLARTMSMADDESFVMLRDIKLNAEARIVEAEISTQPPTDRTGWNVTQEPYRE